MAQSCLELRQLDVILLESSDQFRLVSSNGQVSFLENFLEMGHSHRVVVHRLWLFHFLRAFFFCFQHFFEILRHHGLELSLLLPLICSESNHCSNKQDY